MQEIDANVDAEPAALKTTVLTLRVILVEVLEGRLQVDINYKQPYVIPSSLRAIHAEHPRIRQAPTPFYSVSKQHELKTKTNPSSRSTIQSPIRSPVEVSSSHHNKAGPKPSDRLPSRGNVIPRQAVWGTPVAVLRPASLSYEPASETLYLPCGLRNQRPIHLARTTSP